jgi:SAM-dependent methyltransferase
VLRACARLLKPGGYLVLSVPDLRLHVKAYLSKYRPLSARIYRDFAVRWRVPENAPPSSVFSVFAHQGGYREPLLEGDAHKWCYDFDGVRYQIDRAGGFESIRSLSVFHPLAGTPFTHNRPAEDLCVIATKA